MSKEIGLAGLLWVMVLLAAAASPHPPRPAEQRGNRIYLDVVVTPKTGAADSGLQQQDFTVLDNGAPQTITSFRAVSGREAPMEVTVVLDEVNSSYQSITYQRAELGRFLRSEGGHLAYPIAFAVLTDSGVKMLGEFSSDGNALAASLDENDRTMRTVGRAAGLAGAAERWKLSLTAFRQLVAAEVPRPGHKAMIWVSPGWPILAGQSAELDTKQQEQVFADVVSVSTRLMQARLTVYSVDPLGAAESVSRVSDYKKYLKGVTKPSQVELGHLGLPLLAVQSGGLTFTSSNDIANLLQQCIADMMPYFEISYEARPSDRKDEYHHVEVKMAKPGLTARTRQGYYAQPLPRN